MVGRLGIYIMYTPWWMSVVLVVRLDRIPEMCLTPTPISQFMIGIHICYQCSHVASLCIFPSHSANLAKVRPTNHILVDSTILKKV